MIVADGEYIVSWLPSLLQCCFSNDVTTRRRHIYQLRRYHVYAARVYIFYRTQFSGNIIVYGAICLMLRRDAFSYPLHHIYIIDAIAFIRTEISALLCITNYVLYVLYYIACFGCLG